MLFNLLANALKFTSTGYLQVKHKGVFLHFTVWDTGIGISEEEQTQLFNPISKLPMLLPVVRHWFRFSADSESGRTARWPWVVKSEINHGSQFTVVLPIRVQGWEAGERSSSEQGRSRQILHTARIATAFSYGSIMLVEDNLHNAKLITTYLKKWVIRRFGDAAQMASTSWAATCTDFNGRSPAGWMVLP